MSTTVEIAGKTFQRNQKTRGALALGKRSTGEPLEIPLNLVIGADEGPRLVLVFCQHGDEWITLEGWHEIFHAIDTASLAGEIVALPAANPVAFEAKSRNSWMDALRGAHGNLNRAWPGKADGWLTERIAHAISTNILEDADCVVDLHDGSPGELHIYYSYLARGLGGEYGELMERLGTGFGMDILVSKGLALQGTLSQFLNEKRTPNIGVEIGHFGGFEHGEARRPGEVTATGLSNVLTILGMRDGGLKLPKRQAVVRPETRVKAVNGGLLKSRVTVGDIGKVFGKDEPLFDIIDISSMETLETVTGPYDHNFLLTAPANTVIVNPGDHGCHVADGATLEWIEN